jgi:hypothetical protein
MQLHLETNELNLLANVLMERSGTPQDQGTYNDLLEMVLAHDLRFDTDQLEQLAGLLAAEKRSLQEKVAGEQDTKRKTNMHNTLVLLERVQERVDEVCVMF